MDLLVEQLIASPYYYLRGPMLVFVLAFLETVGIVGFFIPLNIIVIALLATYVSTPRLFALIVVMNFVGGMLGVILGYQIGFRWGSKLLARYTNNYVAETLNRVTTTIHTYANMSGIVIMLTHMRSIFALYRGSSKQSIKPMIISLTLGMVLSVALQAVLGWFGGSLLDLLREFWAVSYERIIGGIVVLILFSFISDIKTWRDQS